MILRKSPTKRVTAVLAGTLLGLTGVVALTSPALAHAPEVAGVTSCAVDGKWTVNWTVGNDWAPTDGTIEKVFVSTAAEAQAEAEDRDKYQGGWGQADESDSVWTAGPIGDIAVGKTLKKNQPVLGASTFADTEDTAVLKIQMSWPDQKERVAKYAVVDKLDACASPEATTSAPATPTPPVETTTSPTPRPSTPASVPPASTPPATTTPASPSSSAPASPSPSASEEAPVGEATPIFELYCDAVVLGLDNTQGTVDVPLVLEPSTGDKVTLMIKAGEEKTQKFAAAEGFTVKIYVKGFEDESETVAWQAPEGCDTAGGAGGGDSLPLTGAAAGSIAAGAVVLLGAGIALFVISRRRKVKFTA